MARRTYVVVDATSHLVLARAPSLWVAQQVRYSMANTELAITRARRFNNLTVPHVLDPRTLALAPAPENVLTPVMRERRRLARLRRRVFMDIRTSFGKFMDKRIPRTLVRGSTDLIDEALADDGVASAAVVAERLGTTVDALRARRDADYMRRRAVELYVMQQVNALLPVARSATTDRDARTVRQAISAAILNAPSTADLVAALTEPA